MLSFTNVSGVSAQRVQHLLHESLPEAELRRLRQQQQPQQPQHSQGVLQRIRRGVRRSDPALEGTPPLFSAGSKRGRASAETGAVAIPGAPLRCTYRRSAINCIR